MHKNTAAWSDKLGHGPKNNGAAKNGKSGAAKPASAPAVGSGVVRLGAALEVFNHDDKVLIIISADPDAIASAVALKRILWRRVSQISVATTNPVKRMDNLQLIHALKLKLPLLSEMNLKGFTKLAMVDSQPGHNPRTSGLHFDLVIDHHPVETHVQSPPPAFVDIRADRGATASMMVGYLKAAKIRPNPVLATALFYAIKTDTQNFVRQGQLEDMKAFRWLYSYIHPPLLSDIERAPIARSSYKRILEGLNGAALHKNAAFTFLDKADSPDTLVILADFLLQINSINRVVAAGICGEQLVVIFRAGGIRQDVGKLAARAFGAYGSAGGHKNMARAEVPLVNLGPRIADKPAYVHRFVIRRLVEVFSEAADKRKAERAGAEGPPGQPPRPGQIHDRRAPCGS